LIINHRENLFLTTKHTKGTKKRNTYFTMKNINPTIYSFYNYDLQFLYALHGKTVFSYPVYLVYPC